MIPPYQLLFFRKQLSIQPLHNMLDPKIFWGLGLLARPLHGETVLKAVLICWLLFKICYIYMVKLSYISIPLGLALIHNLSNVSMDCMYE